ncbi:MAG: hypothetical protein JSV23_04115 [Promethearchaeota archaeon]|nr:MAG: hypothetical protein JSV23_04115 [Candidatus Lokiarchaeota archaeon]
MVLLVSQTWYPASESEKAGKIYLEALKKFPDDRTIAKPILRSGVKMEKEGIHGIAIYSVKEGKFKEAMDLAVNRMLIIGKEIKDVKMSIDTYYDITEALPFVGLTAPEE